MITLALLVATTAVQQERGPWDNYTGPYKLVITWYQSIEVTDYPNRARCEAGRQAVIERAIAKAKQSGMPPESADIAFCIPG